MRIDRYLNECGICSRKEAAIAAKRGGVTVNGVPEKSVARHIDPETDRVCYLGREIAYRRLTYIMLNKPAGYVSATDDKSLPYVTELLSPELRRMGLFPVGRLDRDTVGLMILTNNGLLSHTLLSPKHHVEKVYRAGFRDRLSGAAEEVFAEGLKLLDGTLCKPAKIVCDPDRMGGLITLTEGKYHQIKRMLEAMDNQVVSLERVSFAGIPLDPLLDRGEWRPLTGEEEALLHRAAEETRAP